MEVTFGGDHGRDEDLRFVVAIIVLGAIVAVPPALALLGTINFDSGGGRVGGGIGGLFAFAYVVLGIGLILRKELARTIYCVLAMIGLLFLGIGVLEEIVSPRSPYVSTPAPVSAAPLSARQASLDRAAIEREISRVQADTAMSAPQKATIVAYERQELTRLSQEASVSRPVRASAAPERETGIGRFIPGILLTLIPLLFLLRPRVARLFS